MDEQSGRQWLDDLKRKGWTANPDGSFTAPSRGAGSARPAAPVEPPKAPRRKGGGTHYALPMVMAYFKANGIPEPRPEHRFHPDRKWRFDFAWVDHKLALECEGGIFTHGAHGSIKGKLRDIEKYSQAAALGWRVLPVLPAKLCSLETVELLRLAIRNGV